MGFYCLPIDSVLESMKLNSYLTAGFCFHSLYMALIGGLALTAAFVCFSEGIKEMPGQRKLPVLCGLVSFHLLAGPTPFML